jgi:hypothetical protein
VDRDHVERQQSVVVQGVEQLPGLFWRQHRPFVHLDRGGICESHDVASDIAPALGLSECPTQDRAGEPLCVAALSIFGERAAHLLDIFRCEASKADVAEMGTDVEIDDLPVATPGRCLQLACGVEAVQPLVEPGGHSHTAARGDDALVPGVLCRLEFRLNLSLGGPTKSKLFETRRALNDGAREIDTVINIGKLRSGNYDYVDDEITQVAWSPTQPMG